MGLGDWIKAPGKTPRGRGSGMMSGKEARQYARTAKLCKTHGCNNLPGGHQFQFPQSQLFCVECARKTSTANQERALQNAANRRKIQEERRKKFKEVQDKRRGKN